MEGIWTTSINANGFIIDARTEKQASPFSLRDSAETVSCSIEPNITFASDYDSVLGQIFKDFFSRIDVPRGRSDGT